MNQTIVGLMKRFEYEAPPWFHEDYSGSDCGDEVEEDEPEPKPRNYEEDDASHKSWYDDVGESYEGESLCEENESQVSLEEEGYAREPEYRDFTREEEQDQFMDPYTHEAEIDLYHENKPWCKETECEFGLRDHEGYEDEPDRGEFTHDGEHDQFVDLLGETNPHDEEPWNEDNFGVELEFEGEEPEQRYISFSGHSQGSEAYTRWEQDMDNWFQSNQVLEEEKMTYAEETLTEDAFRHWEREDYMRIDFDEPAYSWEDMKKIMYEEFVKDAEANKQYYVKIDANPKPRRWILVTRSYPKAKPKKACCPEPKRVFPNTQEKKTAAKQVLPLKDVQQLPKPKDDVQKKMVEEVIMYAQGPDLHQEKLIMEPKSYGDENLIEENKLDQKATQGDFKPIQLESTHQEHDGGVITCLLIKEEPPDASLRLPASNEQTMTHDPTILRTKFSQGEGMMRSSNQLLTRSSIKHTIQVATDPTRTYVPFLELTELTTNIRSIKPLGKRSQVNYRKPCI
ncbi:unnamed protein product [Arabis nemorensis]|uniref:Uncharacterized protein n=1 Tax=Arabis nemorensis TaxID=586526 RepID=A0A565CPD2_9BRAS|nr:unnamed protein product [Arabis nemorensis]